MTIIKSGIELRNGADIQIGDNISNQIQLSYSGGIGTIEVDSNLLLTSPETNIYSTTGSVYLHQGTGPSAIKWGLGVSSMTRETTILGTISSLVFSADNATSYTWILPKQNGTIVIEDGTLTSIFSEIIDGHLDYNGNTIAYLSDTVAGSGTTNYISKWSDSNTLTDSLIYDNGSFVGIGASTISGEAKLYVVNASGVTTIGARFNSYNGSSSDTAIYASAGNTTGTSSGTASYSYGIRGHAGKTATPWTNIGVYGEAEGVASRGAGLMGLGKSSFYNYGIYAVATEGSYSGLSVASTYGRWVGGVFEAVADGETVVGIATMLDRASSGDTKIGIWLDVQNADTKNILMRLDDGNVNTGKYLRIENSDGDVELVTMSVDPADFTEITDGHLDYNGNTIAYLSDVNESAVKEVTGDYDLQPTDKILHCNHSAEITITIPTSQLAVDGREITIKDASNNAITYNIIIVGQGAENIEFNTSYIIDKNGNSVTLYFFGTEAFIK